MTHDSWLKQSRNKKTTAETQTMKQPGPARPARVFEPTAGQHSWGQSAAGRTTTHRWLTWWGHDITKTWCHSVAESFSCFQLGGVPPGPELQRVWQTVFVLTAAEADIRLQATSCIILSHCNELEAAERKIKGKYGKSFSDREGKEKEGLKLFVPYQCDILFQYWHFKDTETNLHANIYLHLPQKGKKIIKHGRTCQCVSQHVESRKSAALRLCVSRQVQYYWCKGESGREQDTETKDTVEKFRSPKPRKNRKTGYELNTFSHMVAFV